MLFNQKLKQVPLALNVALVALVHLELVDITQGVVDMLNVDKMDAHRVDKTAVHEMDAEHRLDKVEVVAVEAAILTTLTTMRQLVARRLAHQLARRLARRVARRQPPLHRGRDDAANLPAWA